MEPRRIPTYRSPSGLSADMWVEVTDEGRLVLTVNADGNPVSVFPTYRQTDALITALLDGAVRATFPPLANSGE